MTIPYSQARLRVDLQGAAIAQDDLATLTASSINNLTAQTRKQHSSTDRDDGYRGRQRKQSGAAAAPATKPYALSLRVTALHGGAAVGCQEGDHCVGFACAGALSGNPCPVIKLLERSMNLRDS